MVMDRYRRAFFDTLRKHVAPPVLAPNPGVPTQYELDMLAEAARDRYNFWRTILEGDLHFLPPSADLLLRHL